MSKKGKIRGGNGEVLGRVWRRFVQPFLTQTRHKPLSTLNPLRINQPKHIFAHHKTARKVRKSPIARKTKAETKATFPPLSGNPCSRNVNSQMPRPHQSATSEKPIILPVDQNRRAPCRGSRRGVGGTRLIEVRPFAQLANLARSRAGRCLSYARRRPACRFAPGQLLRLFPGRCRRRAQCRRWMTRWCRWRPDRCDPCYGFGSGRCLFRRLTIRPQLECRCVGYWTGRCRIDGDHRCRRWGRCAFPRRGRGRRWRRRCASRRGRRQPAVFSQSRFLCRVEHSTQAVVRWPAS